MKQLRNYQAELVAKGADDHHYYVLPCGAGKTICAIETVKAMKSQRAVKEKAALIIVSPKLATHQWARVIADQDPDAMALVVEVGDDLTGFDARKPIYLVMHYEALVKHIKALEKHRFLVVVADEAHNLRNQDTQRTIAIKRLRTWRKIAMSGTPTDKTQAELFPVLQWFDDRQFSSYWRFVDDYFLSAINMGTGNKMPSKVKDGKAFRAAVGPYVTVRTKQQITPELPPKQVSIERILMFPEQQVEYDKIRLAKDIEVQLGEDSLLEPLLVPSAMARLLRLQQMASDPQLLGLMVPSAKVEWIENFVFDNKFEPMLIFCKFRETAKYLAKLLGAALVVGQKVDAFDDFLAGKRKVLVGTIEAMGTALDLPMASTTVFMDLSWSSINMRQARERMRDAQVGQPPKRLVYLLAEKSVDNLIMQALVYKFTDQLIATQLLSAEGDDGSFTSVPDDRASKFLAESDA